MEAAAVAARSKRAGLPFCCIKVISDVASESFGLDLNKMRTSEEEWRVENYSSRLSASESGSRLVSFEAPHRGSSAGVGDFLVSCRIGSDITNSDSVGE